MRFVKDPLNLISAATALVWIVVGVWFRPIGDFGVETDFFGDFVPFSRQWMSGNPTIMLGYRGPYYYLVIGILSLVGDSFLLAKILSAACAGASIRIIGGLLRHLWNPTVAVAGALFLAANPTMIRYSYRACTDLVFLALFTGTLALVFRDSRRQYRTWAMAGFLAGLAYLTRYNGVALIPIGLVAALVLARPWPKAAKTAAAFGGLWLAVTAPWLGFLWDQTGDPFWNRNFALIAEEVYGTNPSLANLGQLVGTVGFSSLGEVVQVDPGRFFGTMASNIPRHFWLDIKQLVGPVWAMVGLAGWGLFFLSGRNRPRLIFFMTGLIAFFFLLPVFYNQRFMLPLLIWWSAGVGCAVHYLLARIGPVRQRRLRMGLMVVLVLAAVQGSWMGCRRSQGEAGGTKMPLAVLKLAESVRGKGFSFSEDTPIGARKPHIGYFLGAPVAQMSTQGQMKNPANAGMHYLLVSDFESRTFPSLAPMLTHRRPKQPFPGFRFLAGTRQQEKSGAWQTAALYAVDNPAPWTPADPKAVLAEVDSVEGLDRLDLLRTRLARWYLNWTNDQTVFPLFAKMAPGSRSHPLVQEIEGDAYLADKNYPRAVEIYEDLLEDSGNAPDTLLRLSLAHGLAGEPDKFVSYLNAYADRIYAGQQQTLDDWVNEAAAQCRLRKYIPAAGLMNQILHLDPESPITQLHRMLGYCYLNFRHPDHARAAFARYLELVPGDPEITHILKEDARLVDSRP